MRYVDTSVFVPFFVREPASATVETGSSGSGWAP